jgi:hypothetical protein
MDVDSADGERLDREVWPVAHPALHVVFGHAS